MPSSPHMHTHTQGKLESPQQSIPFRLTPNIQRMIMPQENIDGPLTSYIYSVARVLADPTADIEDFLRIILRDEMVAWYQAHPLEVQQTPLEKTVLISLVKTNVRATLTRIRGVVKPVDPDTKEPSSQSSHTSKVLMTKNVRGLINAAIDPECLCQIEATWCSWL